MAQSHHHFFAVRHFIFCQAGNIVHTYGSIGHFIKKVNVQSRPQLGLLSLSVWPLKA